MSVAAALISRCCRLEIVDFLHSILTAAFLILLADVVSIILAVVALGRLIPIALVWLPLAILRVLGAHVIVATDAYVTPALDEEIVPTPLGAL